LLEQAWLQSGRTAISVQILQEFYVNFVRTGHAAADAATLIDDFSRWPVVDNPMTVFCLGLSLQSRWQISLWDAQILAADRLAGLANSSPRTSTTVRTTEAFAWSIHSLPPHNRRLDSGFPAHLRAYAAQPFASL
jgi:hypothetical protein